MKLVLKETPHVHVVSVSSKDVVNLKTAIAYIIKHLTEKEETSSSSTSGGNNSSNQDPSIVTTDILGDDNVSLHYDKRLRYDFEILADWCKSVVQKDDQLKSLHDMRVVISIDDAHSFDASILTSILKQLQSYISKIPVKLILSVATSIDVFQENLRRSCIRMLQGTSINAHLTGCLEEVILDTVLEPSDPTDILIGPNTFRNIIRRQRESLESIDAFVSSLKYTYMTYYYSNPLSILPSLLMKDPNLPYGTAFLTPSHYHAVRLLPSFKVYIGQIMESNPQLVEPLFEDDSILHEHILKGLKEFILYKNRILYGIMVLEALQQYTYSEIPENSKIISRIDLYSSALLGEISTSSFFSQTERNYARGSLTALSELLRITCPNRSPNIWPCNIDEVPDSFAEFHSKVLAEHKDLLSQFFFLNEDTTSDKYLTVKPDSDIQNPESATKFVRIFRDISSAFFSMLRQEVFLDSNSRSENPRVRTRVTGTYSSYFLNELFIVDTPSLHENVFVPTYRAAIEMALSNPSHYWGEMAIVAAREKQKQAFEKFIKSSSINNHADKLKNSNNLQVSGKQTTNKPDSKPDEVNNDVIIVSSNEVETNEKNGEEQTEEDNEIVTNIQSENEWSASAMAYDPHLCIMYTLYRESSLYINIFDFYTAFMTVLKQPQDENDPLFERKALAWFLQAVAELKLLGILRDSKRKFECVEKLVWRDL